MAVAGCPAVRKISVDRKKKTKPARRRISWKPRRKGLKFRKSPACVTQAARPYPRWRPSSPRHAAMLRPPQHGAPTQHVLTSPRWVGGTLSACERTQLALHANAIRLNDQRLMAGCRQAGALATAVAGGDEPRRQYCSTGPAEQRHFATALAPDGRWALRCRLGPSESRDGSGSARATFQPRSPVNARTVCGRRASRAGRSMVI